MRRVIPGVSLQLSHRFDSQELEAIGRNSHFAHLPKKWLDLRKQIEESKPRPSRPAQSTRKLRSKRFLTREDTADIARRYEVGETTQQIGTGYGISKARVATVLRGQGVTMRRKGLTTEQVTEAAALYDAGQSLAQLGLRFGVSHTTVRVSLKEQGVQMRQRRGWC